NSVLLQEVPETGLLAARSDFRDNRCDAFWLGERFRRHLLDNISLDDVSGLDVTVVRDADAALHAVRDFPGIVLEATQRPDLALEHDYVVAQQAHLGIALDGTIHHLAAGDGADLRDTEGILDFRPSQVGLLDDGIQQAGHGALHFILQLVNDGVQPDVHLLLLSQFLRLAFGADVEADDDRV